jgi:hypothetical protein
MPLRSTTAKWLGSCSVIASALPVLTESVLDTETCALLNSAFPVLTESVMDAETCAPLNKFVVAKPGDKVDLMTRAAVLQESLAKLLKLDWHGKVRAFAGSTKQLELTPRPSEWEKYFESFDAENEDDEATKKRYDDSYLTSAWDFLTENADAPVFVTQYPAEESAAGQIGAHNYKWIRIWNNLPEKLKYTKQVAVAYAKAAGPRFADILPCDFPEAHYIGITHNCMYDFESVPKTLKQNKEFCAKASELAYYNWDCQTAHGWNLRTPYVYRNNVWTPIVPPRVLHNPFSDWLHGQLSPGEYTRRDVLERVKLCGNVLLLHDPAYHADMELVKAALATSRGPAVCGLVSEELRDDLEFMTDAIQKKPWCVLQSSTRLKENVEFCKMAAAKTQKSGPAAWQWVPQSIVDSSPDVATHFLAQSGDQKPAGFVAQINTELMVDLVGRNTRVLLCLDVMRESEIEAAKKFCLRAWSGTGAMLVLRPGQTKR